MSIHMHLVMTVQPVKPRGGVSFGMDISSSIRCLPGGVYILSGMVLSRFFNSLFSILFMPDSYPGARFTIFKFGGSDNFSSGVRVHPNIDDVSRVIKAVRRNLLFDPIIAFLFA